MGEKHWIIIFLCLFVIMQFPGINRGLWRPDEPRVAGICAEMARTGNYFVPHLNGRPFLEQPPLYYAVASMFGSLFGTKSDIPFRMSSLVFGVLTLVITFFIVYPRKGLHAGLLASGILASSWGFFRISRWIMVDISLVCGVTLALYAYLRLLDNPGTRDSIILGLATGLAFMAKGLIGPAIIAVAILIDFIRHKDITVLWRMRPLLILVIALIPVIPWVAGVYHQGGWPFIREVIVVNNIMRFTGASEGAILGHQHGILYYWDTFPMNMLPWTFLGIPAFVASMRSFRHDPYLSWVIGPLILLSLASTKRVVYLAPLYPAVACVVANWLTTASRRKWEDIMLRITWWIAIVGSFVPFAGILIGKTALGVSMGILSLSGLSVFAGVARRRELKEIYLVIVMCIALCTTATVYFSYKNPGEDCLGFAREALYKAGHREVTMIQGDESTAGLFSMTTGRVMPDVGNPSGIKVPGLFVWADKDDQVLTSIWNVAQVDILLEQRVGGRVMRLALIKPCDILILPSTSQIHS